jgi:hypothetical protein
MAREAVMSRFWEVMKHEFHEVLPPTIFFLVAFHIVVLDRILLLRQYGLSLSSVAGATVAALLVAKIVLITDKFPFVNPLSDLHLLREPRARPRHRPQAGPGDVLRRVPSLAPVRNP